VMLRHPTFHLFVQGVACLITSARTITLPSDRS
jgi:hypothetical protein